MNCNSPWADARFNDGFKETSPVGTFGSGASPYGVMDMAGNAWEWTRSKWWVNEDSPTYLYPYDPEDGRESTSNQTSTIYIVRGGSWDNSYKRVRVANRFPGHIANNAGEFNNTGFRVVILPNEN